MKKIALSVLLLANIIYSFGMDKEGISVEKVNEEKCNYFFKSYWNHLPIANLYRFHLSGNDFKSLEENEETIAVALMICEKEIVNEEPTSCELVRLQVLNTKHRRKGYGSLFLQHILKYMRENTKISEIGLFSEPSADKAYDAMNNDAREQYLRGLDLFYKKNGFNELQGFSGVFTYNLRDNKI